MAAALDTSPDAGAGRRPRLPRETLRSGPNRSSSSTKSACSGGKPGTRRVDAAVLGPAGPGRRHRARLVESAASAMPSPPPPSRRCCARWDRRGPQRGGPGRPRPIRGGGAALAPGTRASCDHAPVSLPAGAAGGVQQRLCITCEDGRMLPLPASALDGPTRETLAADGRRLVERTLSLPALPPGRHRLHDGDQPEQGCTLIATPGRCHLPAELAGGGRRFGVAAQLYALRRAGDAGIGDYTTLGAFAAIAPTPVQPPSASIRCMRCSHATASAQAPTNPAIAAFSTCWRSTSMPCPILAVTAPHASCWRRTPRRSPHSRRCRWSTTPAWAS